MARAARRALAAISAASSTVMSWSWLITDITMFIMIWRRRSLRRSSSSSCCVLAGCRSPASFRSESPMSSPFAGPSATVPGRLYALQFDVFHTPTVAQASVGGIIHPNRTFAARAGASIANGGGRMAEATESHEELVKVFDTDEESEAMVVRGLLESAGIEAMIQNREAPQDILPGVGGVVVLVRPEQAQEAVATIEEYRNNPASDADETISEEQA